MAMTAADMPTEGHRATGSGIILGGDRTKEYKRARRGTLQVRALRLMLPLTSVAALALFALNIAKNTGVGTSVEALAIRKILPTDLVMKNPHYEGFGKDGAAYVVDAKSAEQDLLKPNFIKLNEITGVLTHADKTKTNVAAASGHYDHTTGIIDLFESIDVTSESGLKAKLTRATIVAKESILTSPEPVDVSFPSGTIRSKTMELRQKAREVSFVDEVVANLTPPAKTGTAADEAKQPATETAAMFKSDGGPIVVTAGRLDANDTSKIATFSGDVTAVQAEAKLTTPELEITYDGQGLMGTSEKKAGGEAEPQAKSPPKSPQGKISRIVAKEPVVMTRGDTEHVTTKSATFDAQGGTAVLIGDVVMTSGPDRRASSDRVDLDQTKDTALLIGNVVVTQGENELKGRRFFINRKSGTAQLTSPPGIGEGPGRISAHLSRGTPKPGAAKAKPAKAEGDGANAFASFKTDPNAPVSIDADMLDINDTAKSAVFRGEVQAVQGDFVIKSAELTAYYKGDSGLAGAAQPQQKAGQPAKPAQGTELTKIEAKRNVIITSSEGQTATGDWAEYNAKTNMVTMGGNVVLARGQNMVRGTRLVIDMTTGEAKIDTAAPKTAAQQTPGSVATTGGRASAVFFPEQLRDAVEKKKPGAIDALSAPGAKAPIDGWSATTEPAAPTPRN